MSGAHAHHHTGPGYASPQIAGEQPPEQFIYVAGLFEGTGIERPDFIAVIDVDRDSQQYGQIVHRTDMPNVGDELHHFGWNACSSACHSQLSRDTLVVPGFRSSRIHLLDVSDPRTPRVRDVIEPEQIIEKTGLSGPHTVLCMPGDFISVSMLGDRDGNLPGGLAVIDARDFSVVGRWANAPGDQQFMYDFWYQPRQNTLVSSEWGAPNTFKDGFDPADVAAGKYGRRLHFWDLERRAKVQTVDLGDDGLIPLEIRWQHDPDSRQGFVGATLSSNIIRFHSENGSWDVEKVIDVANEPLEGWPLPGGVPGLITDLVLSLDLKVQEVAEKALGDHRGAVVALDPRNGDVFALASRPGFDPSLFARGITNSEYAALTDNIDKPLLNRALRGAYPSGSPIKPVVALAGLCQQRVSILERNDGVDPRIEGRDVIQIGGHDLDAGELPRMDRRGERRGVQRDDVVYRRRTPRRPGRCMDRGRHGGTRR